MNCALCNKEMKDCTGEFNATGKKVLCNPCFLIYKHVQ